MSIDIIIHKILQEIVFLLKLNLNLRWSWKDTMLSFTIWSNKIDFYFCFMGNVTMYGIAYMISQDYRLIRITYFFYFTERNKYGVNYVIWSLVICANYSEHLLFEQRLMRDQIFILL